MLKFRLITFEFFRFFQNGLFFDFIIKKFIEVCNKNIFIYTSFFFGEKYMIEYLTKKIIDTTLFSNNKLWGISELSFSLFFINFLSFVFFILGIINFWFFF